MKKQTMLNGNAINAPNQKVPKQFMNCLKKVSNAQKNGLSKLEVQALLYELEDIAFEHFKDEYTRAINSGVKASELQIKQHNTFLLKIQDFAFEYLYGTQSNFPSFVKYLNNWAANYAVPSKKVAIG